MDKIGLIIIGIAALVITVTFYQTFIGPEIKENKTDIFCQQIGYEKSIYWFFNDSFVCFKLDNNSIIYSSQFPFEVTRIKK